jgi:hypothetical protein
MMATAVVMLNVDKHSTALLPKAIWLRLFIIYTDLQWSRSPTRIMD